MDHEDPTLDVEAALGAEQELANLTEHGAVLTPEDEQHSATRSPTREFAEGAHGSPPGKGMDTGDTHHPLGASLSL